MRAAKNVLAAALEASQSNPLVTCEAPVLVLLHWSLWFVSLKIHRWLTGGGRLCHVLACCFNTVCGLYDRGAWLRWCHNLLCSCLKLRLRYLCDGLGKSWSAKCFRYCLLVGVLTFVGLLLVSEALGAKCPASWVTASPRQSLDRMLSDRASQIGTTLRQRTQKSHSLRHTILAGWLAPHCCLRRSCCVPYLV